MTPFEERVRRELAEAAASVEPARTLADLRARIGRPVSHAETTHLCPARRCPRQVPDHLLMCGIHWRLVPPPIQRAVNAAYRGPESIGSPGLVAAQRAAIEAVNRRLEPTEEESRA